MDFFGKGGYNGKVDNIIIYTNGKRFRFKYRNKFERYGK